MKKFFSVLLIISILFSFTACGSNDKETTHNNNNSPNTNSTLNEDENNTEIGELVADDEINIIHNFVDDRAVVGFTSLLDSVYYIAVINTDGKVIYKMPKQNKTTYTATVSSGTVFIETFCNTPDILYNYYMISPEGEVIYSKENISYSSIDNGDDYWILGVCDEELERMTCEIIDAKGNIIAENIDLPSENIFYMGEGIFYLREYGTNSLYFIDAPAGECRVFDNRDQGVFNSGGYFIDGICFFEGYMIENTGGKPLDDSAFSDVAYNGYKYALNTNFEFVKIPENVIRRSNTWLVDDREPNTICDAKTGEKYTGLVDYVYQEGVTDSETIFLDNTYGIVAIEKNGAKYLSLFNRKGEIMFDGIKLYDDFGRLSFLGNKASYCNGYLVYQVGTKDYPDGKGTKIYNVADVNGNIVAENIECESMPLFNEEGIADVDVLNEDSEWEARFVNLDGEYIATKLYE